METTQSSPHEELSALLKEADASRVEEFLRDLPSGDVARAVLEMNEADRAELLTSLPPEDAAEVIQSVPEEQAIELIEQLKPAEAAAIVEELPSDEQADLVGELSTQAADDILAAMSPEAAADLRSLTQYDDDTAGGLMVTEYLAYPADATVKEVVKDMKSNRERYRDYSVQYAYVTGPDDKLVGVLRLRDLLLAERREPIRSLMIINPITVSCHAELDTLRDFFDVHPFLGVPVTDPEGRLLGILQREDVEEALRDRDVSDFRKSQGILQEELRTMPVLVRSRRRLAWLSVNIGLNVIAASVIAVYQDVLAQVIALAVFLPIISDMSGCSGGQAVAVSMRELSLGFVKPNEVLRVWGKELAVGLINGSALGVLIAVVAWLWKGNPYLGLVVGVAMGVNTIVAVSIGGTLPLFMRGLKMDPALASGPILTTITDMCGFFLILSLASLLLPWLVG